MQSSIGIGIQAFREGRFGEAVAIFEEIRQAQAGNEKLGFLLGQAYQSLGRAADARLAFTQLLTSSDPQLAQLASKALDDLGDQGLADVPTAESPAPEVYCPRCGELIPPDRLSTPWCVCGWGMRSHSRVIYLSHLQHYCRARRVAIELKLHGDLYVVANDVRIRHMSDQATKSDPRLVFRSERGVPFIAREDLDLIIPKVDERALFRERRGQELGVGKLFTWEDLYEQINQRIGDPSAPPDGSLRAMLTEFGGISADLIQQVEASQGEGSLGKALVRSGACTVFELLAGALGPARVFAPKHHQANQLGRLLVEAGALDEDALKRALVAQMKTGRQLSEILKTQVPPKEWKQALAKLDKLPHEGPESDRLGEVLISMGSLSRTDLAHALQERQKRNRLFGKILVERGMVPPEALSEALIRQEIKRTARFQGEARLGAILVDMAFATPKTIAMALVQQIRRPRPLGELLIEMDACTPEQLITALSEQERRLDALVEERLPEALEKARAAEENPEEPAKPKLKRAPLPDEIDEEAVREPKPLTLPSTRVLVVAGSVLAIGLLGFNLKGILFPAEPEAPPMLKAMATVPEGAVPGEREAQLGAMDSGKALSSLNAANTVDVDVDQVMGRMEAGDPNPLGAEFMGAYQQPLPPSLSKMAANTVGDLDDRTPGVSSASMAVKPAVAATPLPRLMEFVRPVADEDAPDDASTLAGLSQPGASELLMEGDRLIAKGKPREAVETLRLATQEQPDDPDAFRHLGRAQRKSGQLADAELSLLRAAQLDPQDARNLAELGNVRMAQGNLDAAIDVLQAAAKREPSNHVFQNKLGLALKADGRMDEAAAAFEVAIKADPSNPNSHYNLGLIKVGSDAKAARKHFDKAIKGFSELVQSRMAFGEALKVQGDVPEALASFQGALKANTLLAETQMAMGKLALSEKRFDEGKKHFGAAKLTYRTNAIAHAQMGDAFMTLKQSKEASEEWFLATRIAPNYAPPYYQLGLLSKANGKPAEAKRFLKQAMDADPGSELAALAKKHLSQLEPVKKGSG
jgi:tetratricopeptide (TPR) repeat protein